MMPPPRRFSAAPMLTCPHRNKSSSHSSSSLHHAYSIDSSESMITVVPANRGPFGISSGAEYKRSSRGSISYQSGGSHSQLHSPGGSQATQGSPSLLNLNQSSALDQTPAGSCYALPRSPLSPRSPSRLSPLLTPSTETGTNFSNAPSGLEPPFSPANTSTTTTTYSSNTALTTIIQQQQQQQQQQTIKWLLDAGDKQRSSNNLYDLQQPHQQTRFFMSTSVSGSGGFLFSGQQIHGTSLSFTAQNQQFPEEDSSLAVENGTSFNSSRNGLDELDSIVDEEPNAMFNCESKHQAESCSPQVDQPETSQDWNSGELKTNQDWNCPTQPYTDFAPATTFDATSLIDPNEPIVCETINDFCARHSREELEYLVSQIDGLRISECYFSEQNSTLCMVVEVSARLK